MPPPDPIEIERKRRGDPAFGIRFWSAAVLAPLAVLTAWLGGWVFAFAVAAGGALMIYEWVRMSDRGAASAPVAMGVIPVAAAILLAAQGLWVAAFAVLAVSATAAAFERRGRGSAWRAAFGIAYIGLPCLALIWVRAAPERGFLALAFLFSVVWAADIAAYLIGSWVQGPKLLPRASPNKTWSGLIAGLTAGGLLGALGWLLLGEPWNVGAAIGLVLAASAVSGDLLESILKRKFGVKDTGSIIPGHGGVLDRVDALMGAVLTFAVLIGFWASARAGFF